MRKPSELVEGEAIGIHSPEGTICFHQHYGELTVSAANANTNPLTCMGIDIPMTENAADELYEHWQSCIANRDHNKISSEKRYPTATDEIRIQHYHN